MMTTSKIHPAENKCNNLLANQNNKGRPCVLTVWKRSSMSFQGTDGFTVFDERGRLVFRMDNYSRRKNPSSSAAASLLLMDGVGNALLSFKSQMFSLHHSWSAYRGEDGCGNNIKLFSMRSQSVLYHTGKSIAEIFMGGIQIPRTPDFRIEGSFRSRDCKIRSHTGQVVAKIARKRVSSTILLSDDVFSLTVQPGFDTQLIMAFVIILDRICHKPCTPFLCS